MKKISLILAAFALVLGISQCRKQETPAQSGEKQHIVLTASNGNDGSKVAVGVAEKLLKLTWETTDVIDVSGGAEGTLTYKSGEGATATFEGYVTKLSDEPIVFSVGTENYQGQAGTIDGLKSRIYLKSDPKDFQPSGNYVDVHMTLQYAVLKLDVSKLGTSGLLTITAGRETIASVTDVLSSEGKSVFVAVPANGASTEYTISCGGKIAKEPWTLVANTFYTKDDGSGDGTGEAIVLEQYSDPDLLPGRFSVSAVDYVQFSRGNLQATYNGSGYTFDFAANQYDYVGGRDRYGVGPITGNNTIDSQTAGAVVDLFGWSTSATNYGINTAGEHTGSTVYGGVFKDWGTAIDNTGNWCTLSGTTSGEWVYLLEKRTVNGGSGEGYTYTNKASGIVLQGNTYYGLFLYPDDYDKPLIGTVGAPSTWEDINASGIVFLPAAGYRYASGVESLPGRGSYWAGTESGNDKAYDFYYISGIVYDNLPAHERCYGFSVRLVQRFPKPIEYVEIAGLKWTKQNLAISGSGKKSWKGGNETAVKVPGSDEDVINGDYFQWATYAGYCGNVTDADKGLLIYDSFTSEMCGDGSNIFTYKPGKQFEVSSTPYYSGSSYSKYTSGDVNLEDSDDVAKIILGGSWRMPTATEFNTMYNATYWAWDATDNGYYVYTPNPSTDAGKCNDGTGTYNKSNALLFFPAAGYGSNNYPNLVGNYGLYWSSNLNSDDPPFKASNLYFHSSGVTPQDGGGRYSGLPVRPVHD